MIDKLMFDNASLILERGAIGASRRQEALSHNVSNVNTPGYVRQDIDFKDALIQAMAGTQEESDAERSRVGEVLPEAFSDLSSPLRMDGSNVDIDKEMSSLAQNALEYQTFVRLLNDKFKIMRSAMSGR